MADDVEFGIFIYPHCAYVVQTLKKRASKYLRSYKSLMRDKISKWVK